MITAFIHRAVMTLDWERRVATTMLIVVALLAGLSAQAQIYETTYTVINGSSLSGGESCRKLLDGDIHTKWCEFCGNEPIYVEFSSAQPFVPTAYILTTGNDNVLNNYRNPQRWRLYGRLNELEDWTELAYVDKDESMVDKNFAPYEFSLNNPDHMSYQYFKFVIYDIRSFYLDYCQLSEFQFKGYNSLDDMKDAVVDIQPIYDYNNGETIPVDFTVKDGLGNTIDPSHYNVAYNPYGEVSVEGEYELCLTGTNGFTGEKYVTFRVMKQLTGAGTEDSPYLINSDADWDLFAERVREGDTYKGKYVKLASDIHVSTMAGSSEVYSFQGTFDGDLHTMELNLTATEDACAPFRYLKDAQIKNLNITGTVSSAYCYAASLAAYGYGTCGITNCGSMATITSTRTGNGKSFHGGFIAVYYPKWSLTFTDCIFAGKMLGDGSYAVGGFVGYSFASVYYNHCLYAGTEFTMDDRDSYTFNGNSDYSVFRGAYITTGIDSWYGTKVYTDVTKFSKVEFDYGGIKYYTRASVKIDGVESVYDVTDSVIDIHPVVYYDDQQLTEGSDYELTITPTPIQQPGSYTMTFTGKGDYAGTETSSFWVNYPLAGKGTAENPYLIPDSEAWDAFALNMKEGAEYTGKYLKLTDDFDNSASPVTTMAGTDQHRFKGIFLGNHRTLTVNLSGSNKFMAPFSYIEDATIQDLTVTGTITSTKKGDGSHGGFAGINNGNSTFKNCIFKGSLLGEVTNSCGGFVGWTNGNLTYEDCVFNPAEITMSSDGSATFNRNGNNNLTRCYYTTPFGEAQGIRISDDANSVHTHKQIEIDGKNYYCVCDISGLSMSYKYTGAPIAVTPIVEFGGQRLEENCDYMVRFRTSSYMTITSDHIEDIGEYAVTITGIGYYEGTYTAPFYIISKEAVAEYLFQKGQDEEGEFYGISSSDDFNALGTFVDTADSVTSGMRFKLMNDIEVTTMIGTNEDTRSFQGTFDGNGKTLTLNLNGGDNDQFLAPFRYVKDATIRNLIVAGTITSTRYGDGTHGGFVALSSGETTFENCAFTGSLLGETTNSCGGFVGWNKGSLTFTDCVFDPAQITMSSKYSATFNRNGNNTLTRCYYTTPFGEVQGVRVSDNANSVHTNEQIVIDGKNYYRTCDISGLSMGYKYTGAPIAVTPVVQFEGQTLTENTDYTVIYTNSSDETVAADNIAAVGQYTITITGKGYYAGTYTAPFYILDKEALAGYFFQKGQDEEGEFYEISSSDDFNALGTFVGKVDHATSGMRFKLMNDIEVTTMIGTNKDTRSFQGTFDGNGKTLTLNLSGGDNDQFLAPFRYASAATFRNLIVAGTITSAVKGDGTHGGFVGISNGETTFENCAFIGSLLGETANSCGGFVGWNDGNIHYIDCIFAPTEITMNSQNSATFNRNGRNDFVRTYYLTAYGEKQGTQVFLSDIEGTVSRVITAADGNTYYVILCYAISSAADWQTLAEKVQNDELGDFPVVMTDDIEVNTSIGTADHPFRGKFLGNGKTLTVNLNSDEKYLAPFSYVEDATIRNLTVAGTITSTVWGDGTSGGFVGVSNGETTFEKCAFIGSLLGETTNSCGGFVGWNKVNVTFTDCLFAPARIMMGSDNSATFSRNFYGKFTRTFFATPFGEEQGIRVYTNQEDVPNEVVAIPETLFNGATYYVDCGLRTDSTIPESDPGHYYINMPASDITYATIPASIKSFKVYDNGGKAGNAYLFCRSEQVLTVPSDCQIRVTGNVVLYDNKWDVITFYDGDNRNAPRLASYSDASGEPKAIGPVISGRESMDIYFENWDAEDKCNIDLTVDVIDLMLNDQEDNDSLITEKLNTTVNTVLRDRKLHKDDKWNTLCLPFALSAEQIAASDLAGATILELDTDAGSYDHPTGYENDTLYLNFKAAASIEAGKPYIVKWTLSDSDSIATDIVNPFFSDVTILSNEPETVTSSDGKVSLVGTYNPVTFAGEDGSILFLGATNTLYYPATNINAFRAYFQLTGITASPESSLGWETVRHVVFQVLGERTSTGITLGSAPVSEGYWYDLSGRRLDGKPTQRGVYIRNGKKFVIK